LSFLRDRDVELELKGVFEENPWFDVLHYLGIQRIYVSPEKLELGKLYGYIDESLQDFIDEYVSKGYFWSVALNISNFKSFALRMVLLFIFPKGLWRRALSLPQKFF